jgi:hydroxyacylglutathione hydrolase
VNAAPREVGDGIWCVTAGAYPSNCYIVADDTPGGAVLIDAGMDALPIEAALETLGLQPSAIFCTHGHFDHIGGAAHFQRKFDLSVYLHVADQKVARSSNMLLLMLGMPQRISLPKFTLIEDGFAATLRGCQLVYSNTPGHTPGSCTMAFGDALFTGDTLYARNMGPAPTPGEKPDQLRASVLAMWNGLDGVTVHPGHGPSAPGRDVRLRNMAVRAFLGVDHAGDCDVPAYGTGS